MNHTKQPQLPKWHLYDRDGKAVASFIPKVLVRQHVLTPTGEECETLLRLSLNFSDGAHVESTVPFSDLERLNWPELDYRCIVSSSYRNARGYIANIIRAGLDCAPVETVYRLDRAGIFHIKDAIIFAAGDRVVTRSSATEATPNFDLGQIPFHLDIDPELTIAEAFEGMGELINLSAEIGRVLVAHVISGITRAAFKEAGLTPCAVLVVMGKSGILKSHYVPHMVQLYNRQDGIGAVTRFNSTKRFIEDTLHDYSECTAVIDDLHTAESRSIKRRNEETAEEIIRRIGDDTGRGRMNGHTQVQQQFRGNAVFIGEYTIGKASTIPRALVVEITSPPNGTILDKYQRHRPLVVSTFYYYFIQWYVDHFAEICATIDDRLTKFRETTANSSVHGRLRDTQLYLQISYMLFLKFCTESQCCSRQDATEEYKNFSRYLARLIQAQQVRFNQDSNSKSVDYPNFIRYLYHNNSFILAKSKKDFNPSVHDGLIYYDCLCLRGERLKKRLRQLVPNFNFNDCIASLLAAGALKLVENKYTVQIDGTGGIRFYAIRI
ncbi:hypothetical protein [Faecalibaculum rodentium]|uniref:hypothetical protein n=1 Tax=Faecalibaculum rodentium TaxID=1702221 RepID=UPI0025B745CE|nr:hypothetical protein [Faecalibaculum rodentium]